MTLEDIIRCYVSILVDVAKVDGIYDMAEIDQLLASTLTLFDSEEVTVELTIDVEYLVTVINEPVEWTTAIEVVSALDYLNRVQLFQQAVGVACSDDYVTFDEDILITVLFVSIFSEDEQAQVSQYLDLMAQLAVLEAEMFS